MSKPLQWQMVELQAAFRDLGRALTAVYEPPIRRLLTWLVKR